jgi:hypothetical protein
MGKKSNDDFDHIDYSNLPEEVEKVVKNRSETITKEAKISYDGKQHIVRIPTEISKTLNISAEDTIKFTATLYDDDTREKHSLDIEYVKR